MIIGAKAATKRRIEGETRTQIKIPKQGMTGDVEITGASRDNVCSARRRVEMIVLASRSKQSPTHFVTIRISDPEIRRNYERFMVGQFTLFCAFRHSLHTILIAERYHSRATDIRTEKNNVYATGETTHHNQRDGTDG